MLQPTRRLLVHLGLVFAAAAGLTLFTGFQVHHGLMEGHFGAHRQELFGLTKDMNALVRRLQGVSQSIASRRPVISLLEHPDPDLHAEVDLVLKTVRDAFAADLVYVMDRRGDVLASTLYDDGKTLKGNNYAFRPYFTGAMAGRDVVYMAVGVTTRIRGIYYSQPVRHVPDGPILGVVVIKMGLSDVDELLHRFESPTLLASPEGVVFASNRRDWLFRTLSPLPPETLQRLRASRQFADYPLSPVGLPLRDSILRLDGERYSRIDSGLAFPGWRVVTYRRIEYPRLLMLVGAAAAGYGGLAILLSLYLISRHNRFMLARRIEERTRDLMTAGQRLEEAQAEQRQTASELHETSERFRAVFEGAEDIIYIKDTDFRYVMVNPSAERLLGLRPDRMIGSTSGELLQETSPGKSRAIEERVLQGEVVHSEESFVFGDRTQTFSIIRSPLRNADGIIDGVCGIARDVTDRKMTEQALVRAERLAAVGTLAGGVAHEFNNINASVMGFAELLLQMLEPSSEAWDYLQRIRRAAGRAKSITQNLLTFSGAHKSKTAPTDLNPLVEEALALVQHEWETQGIVVEKELHSLPQSVVDSGQIVQVILNLLINAGHAVIDEPERIIRISTAPEGDWIVLRVADTGCGIRQEDLTKIFTPFYSTKGEHATSDTAQSRLRGTGLGLSVCHAIVSDHGGELRAESVVGEGAVFTMRLPVLRGESPAPSKPPLSPNDGKGTPPGTLLILDDEEDTRTFLTLYLDRKGHRVLSTDDGHEALEDLEREKVEVVLLDLQMALMTGEEFLRRLAERPQARQPKVLVITGHDKHREDEALDNSRVFDVLQKPFELEEVDERIRAALAAAREEA